MENIKTLILFYNLLLNILKGEIINGMKRILILLVCSCVSVVSFTQNLFVEGTAPNLYINHTVFAKENYYSIGRLYNQSPKVIAEFNGLTLEKGLNIGQKIKIPLTAQNFETIEKPANGEVLVPLKHIVQKGENIFKIGTQYNTTAVLLRNWNILSSDVVGAGTALIVGRLKVKAGESKLASGKNEVVTPVIPKPTSPVAPKEVATLPVKEEAVSVGVSTPPPAVKPQPASGTPPPPPAKKEDITVVHAPSKSTESVPPTETPGTVTPAKGSGVVSSGSVPPVNTNKGIDLSTLPASVAEGAFSALFSKNVSDKSINTKSGDAATFKSTSGWQDRKYYVLMNDVTPGTIVKLQSGSGKVIYAKVLGSIPEMKENNGLLLRLSNSAASYLGIFDPRFPVEVSYYK